MEVNVAQYDASGILEGDKLVAIYKAANNGTNGLLYQ